MGFPTSIVPHSRGMLRLGPEHHVCGAGAGLEPGASVTAGTGLVLASSTELTWPRGIVSGHRRDREGFGGAVAKLKERVFIKHKATRGCPMPEQPVVAARPQACANTSVYGPQNGPDALYKAVLIFH